MMSDLNQSSPLTKLSVEKPDTVEVKLEIDDDDVFLELSEQDAFDFIQDDDNVTSFTEVVKVEDYLKEEIVDDSCVNLYSTLEVKDEDDANPSSEGVSPLQDGILGYFNTFSILAV